MSAIPPESNGTHPFARRLDTIRLADTAQVGSKAASLGSLLAAGFPVPEGLVLTTAAFAAAMRPHLPRLTAVLTDRDLQNPTQVAEAAQLLIEVLAPLTVPPAVADALLAEAPPWLLEGHPAAVRSSATAEDLADASFAGAYETVIGARGMEAVLAAIVACWRSFFTPGALATRVGAGLGHDGHGMAVLVQRLIEAECAGVCYTVDPVRNRSDLLVVNAVWGLGSGAVDGSVAADTAWVRKDELSVDEQRIAEKMDAIVLGSPTGTQREFVPEERRRAACLPPAWLRRVAEFSLAAEQVFGRPQDVEWAVADQRLWILQSRPIAALPADLQRLPAFPVALDDASDRSPAWQPGRQEPPLPLLLDVGAAGRAGSRDSPVNWADTVEEVRIFHGYPYRRRVPSDLREGDIRARTAARGDRAAQLRERGVTPWEHLVPEVAAAVERLARFDLGAADGAALATQLEDAFGAYRRHWALHWEMVGLAREFGAPFRAAFEAVSGLAGEPANHARGRVVHGEESELTLLVDRLYELAQTALAAPTAVADIVRDAPADAMQRMADIPAAAAFRERLDALLERYGDHSGSGFGSSTSLETPTWREDPTLVLRLLAFYLDPRAESPAALRHRVRTERDAHVESLCAACEDATAVAAFRRWLPLARRVAADLENHNHYIDQCATGQLRAAVLAAGANLLQRGALAAPLDVFWLRRVEIVDALRAEAAPDLRTLVDERRTCNAEQRAMRPPALLGTPDAALPARPEPSADGGGNASAETGASAGSLVRGEAASPGRVRGRARVVDSKALVPDVEPGDILVSTNAGPLWTPLFPVLGGLVLDQGAMLQHAAAVAREYGVPAVLQTKDATKRIPDGAFVVVDGAAGTVEIEAVEGQEGPSSTAGTP